MSAPEARLASFCGLLHLSETDTNYLLALMQEARALGSEAGADAERDACAQLAESTLDSPLPHMHPEEQAAAARRIARAIRARAGT